MPIREHFLERLKPLRDHWWLFYGAAIAIFLLIIAYDLTAPPPSLDAQSVIYAEFFYLLGYWPLQPIGVAGLIVGSILFSAKRRSLWFGLGIFCLPILLFLAYALFVPPPANETKVFTEWAELYPKHLITRQIGEYTFNLLGYREYKGDAGFTHYNLYQCDILSIRCNLVYRYEVRSYQDALADLRYPPSLEMNGSEVKLFIGGKLAYHQSVI